MVSKRILMVFVLLTTGASLRLSHVTQYSSEGSSVSIPLVDEFNNGHWEPSTKSHKDGPLRYEWKLHQKPMKDFDEKLFCQQDTGNVLFVGDSTTLEHWSVFRDEFHNWQESSPADWLPKGEDPTCGSYRSFKVCDNNRTIAMVKSLLLDMAPHHEHAACACVEKTGCSGTWANNELINQFGTLVINTGAHWHEYEDGKKMEDYTKLIEATVNFLKPYHHLKTYFRTTVPGFAGCTKYENDQPLTNVGDAEKFVQSNPYWDHTSFKAKNEIAMNAFAKAGLSVLDAYTPSILRLDGHVDDNDCLHYVRPGPMPHWDKLLLNLMLSHDA